MLRILGRVNTRNALAASGDSKRAPEELSGYLGVYLGTDPDAMAVRSTILRLL